MDPETLLANTKMLIVTMITNVLLITVTLSLDVSTWKTFTVMITLLVKPHPVTLKKDAYMKIILTDVIMMICVSLIAAMTILVVLAPL
jgi:hypothetical protein